MFKHIGTILILLVILVSSISLASYICNYQIMQRNPDNRSEVTFLNENIEYKAIDDDNYFYRYFYTTQIQNNTSDEISLEFKVTPIDLNGEEMKYDYINVSKEIPANGSVYIDKVFSSIYEDDPVPVSFKTEITFLKVNKE